MEENNRKPAIRFSGFANDWEQRKLRQFCSYSTSNLTANDVDIEGQYDLYDANTVIGKTNKNIQGEDYITIIKDGSGVGRVRLLPKNSSFIGTMGALKNEKSDIIFLMCCLIKTDFGKEITGATIPHVYFSNYGENAYSIPRIDEQVKIGVYFKQLDNLITLHQCKYEKLINMKQAMLGKMFPQNDSDVPEIRFKGFTDAWERRKLESVAIFSKGRGYSKGDLQESGTPIILYGRLYTKYETTISEVDTFVEAKNDSIYSKGGEVIIPASGETAEDIARAATVENIGVLLGGDLNVITPNTGINPTFLALSISNGNPQKELAKKAQGKSVVHIHNEEIKNLVIPFPNKDEQKQISQYFTNLDNLITLHQGKLEKLQNIKKACLERMFV